MLTVVAIASAAHAARNTVRVEHVLIVLARIGGEFNWSSQHLDEEVLQYRDGNGDGQTGRAGLRCGRLVGRR